MNTKHLEAEISRLTNENNQIRRQLDSLPELASDLDQALNAMRTP